MRRVLIVPGIGNSGPGHWQSRWEQAEPQRFTRLEQHDWERPQLRAWQAAFDAAVSAATEPVIVVAHSLGCLLAVASAARCAAHIAAMMLVSVPDPSAPAFPSEACGFDDVPLDRLPWPSVVVASSDDPFGSLAHMERQARRWGSDFVCIGPNGHINADSGLGDWPQGKELLRRLQRRAAARPLQSFQTS